MPAVPEVLFVCTHNAGRSQLAAALLAREAAGRVRVSSAGSQPASQLNPAVVAALAELGLDLSQEFSKPLTGDKVRAADVVITMGCGDACPVYPGQRYLDWDLPDPAGLSLEAVRPIRDAIHARVRTLLAELLPPPANPPPSSASFTSSKSPTSPTSPTLPTSSTSPIASVSPPHLPHLHQKSHEPAEHRPARGNGPRSHGLFMIDAVLLPTRGQQLGIARQR